MSFILDALRRAETQRGARPAPPVTSDSAFHNIADEPSKLPSLRRIVMLLAGLVAVALLAMILLANRDDSGNMANDAGQAAPAPIPSFPTIAPDTPLAEVAVPATREVRPLLREAQPPRVTPPAVAPTVNTPPRTAGGSVSYSEEELSANAPGTRTLTNLPDNAPRRDESLPSYDELAMSSSQLPEFHLDIHVYAAEPDRRFVFVNNRKYREGQALDEGGTVERITPAGVVLNHRGRRFELVPD